MSEAEPEKRKRPRIFDLTRSIFEIPESGKQGMGIFFPFFLIMDIFLLPIQIYRMVNYKAEE